MPPLTEKDEAALARGRAPSARVDHYRGWIEAETGVTLP
jgi:hypothetical protein